MIHYAFQYKERPAKLIRGSNTWGSSEKERDLLLPVWIFFSKANVGSKRENKEQEAYEKQPGSPRTPPPDWSHGFTLDILGSICLLCHRYFADWRKLQICSSDIPWRQGTHSIQVLKGSSASFFCQRGREGLLPHIWLSDFVGRICKQRNTRKSNRWVSHISLAP